MGRRLAGQVLGSGCSSSGTDGEEWGWSALGSEKVAESCPTIGHLDWVREHRNMHGGQTYQDRRG